MKFISIQMQKKVANLNAETKKTQTKRKKANIKFNTTVDTHTHTHLAQNMFIFNQNSIFHYRFYEHKSWNASSSKIQQRWMLMSSKQRIS